MSSPSSVSNAPFHSPALLHTGFEEGTPKEACKEAALTAIGLANSGNGLPLHGRVNLDPVLSDSVQEFVPNFYCRDCKKPFNEETQLQQHREGKYHKKNSEKLRASQGNAATQASSESASSLSSGNNSAASLVSSSVSSGSVLPSEVKEIHPVTPEMRTKVRKIYLETGLKALRVQSEKTPDSNCSISPNGLIELFSMHLQGIMKPEIKKNVLKAFDLVEDEQKFHLAIQSNRRQMMAVKAPCQFTSFNAVMARFHTPYYAQKVGDNNDATFFAPIPPVSEVNELISKNTGGMIPEFFKGSSLEHTHILLLNALYFEAPWAERFEKNAIRRREFHCSNGNTQTVVMMEKPKATYKLLQAEGLLVLEMPYQTPAGSDLPLSLLILMPDDKQEMDELLNSLTAEKLEGYLSRLLSTEIHFSFPQQTISAETNLSPEERKTVLSLPEGSTPLDYPGPMVYMQAVKAIIDANGTKVAAASAATRSLACGGSKPEDVEINRPFLQMIRLGDTILFMSVIRNASEMTATDLPPELFELTAEQIEQQQRNFERDNRYMKLEAKTNSNKVATYRCYACPDSPLVGPINRAKAHTNTAEHKKYEKAASAANALNQASSPSAWQIPSGAGASAPQAASASGVNTPTESK